MTKLGLLLALLLSLAMWAGIGGVLVLLADWLW